MQSTFLIVIFVFVSGFSRSVQPPKIDYVKMEQFYKGKVIQTFYFDTPNQRSKTISLMPFNGNSEYENYVNIIDCSQEKVVQTAFMNSSCIEDIGGECEFDFNYKDIFDMAYYDGYDVTSQGVVMKFEQAQFGMMGLVDLKILMNGDWVELSQRGTSSKYIIQMTRLSKIEMDDVLRIPDVIHKTCKAPPNDFVFRNGVVNS